MVEFLGRAGMKIVHINTNYVKNTLHQSMMDVMLGMGIESKVICPTCDFKTSVVKPKDYVEICECFSKMDRVWYGNKQRKILSHIISNYDLSGYDICHAYTLFTDGNVAYNLKKKYGIPYVVAVRNTDVNTFFKYMIHLRKRGIEILKNASAVFFLSKAYEKIVFEKYIPEKYAKEIKAKSYIMPNGLDPFWLANVPEYTKKALDKEIRICYAGRIEKNKNCNLTVEACKKLINEGYDIKYTVIGKMVDESFKSVIEENEFITHIPFLQKEELAAEFRKNDIFVMPSFTETFGMVYAEAMSQGLPVVYTKGEGFDGQFAEGEVGYAVSSYDAYDVANAIERIVTEYDLMSQRCINSVKRFNWETISLKYKKIYENICC